MRLTVTAIPAWLPPPPGWAAPWLAADGWCPKLPCVAAATAPTAASTTTASTARPMRRRRERSGWALSPEEWRPRRGGVGRPVTSAPTGVAAATGAVGCGVTSWPGTFLWVRGPLEVAATYGA